MAEVPRKVVRLKLIGGGAVELRNDVPRTRADCPTTRPCGHVRCRYHLWRDDDRNGHPRLDGSRPSPELRAAWLEWPVPSSCALDVAERVARERGSLRVEDLARELGRRPSRFYGLLAAARRKIAGALSAMGLGS